MGDTTIEWTDKTWNPVTGCTKVSQGCKNCYAERIFARPYPGRAFTDVRCHEDRLTQPLKWTKGRRIFVNSMSDLFHEDIPFEFIDKVFSVMACTTRHTYQVLTKRPQRMLDYFSHITADYDDTLTWTRAASSRMEHDLFHPKQIDPLTVWPKWIPYREGKRGGYDNCGPGWPLDNVWLGVSVEDQETANERIPLLLRAPGKWTRFLSCEPLLGPLRLDMLCTLTDRVIINALTGQSGAGWDTVGDFERGLDWIIAGGESGPKARPSHPDWFRFLRDQCAAAGVAFFFKQYGEWAPYDRGAVDSASLATRGALDKPLQRFGKKSAGRTLDGRTHDDYPLVK